MHIKSLILILDYNGTNIFFLIDHWNIYIYIIINN